ncbi:MAG: small ribosomal subunit Rsm22 family protein [Candidatus Scalindua sp.]|nr:small ribosomal subunit Rsm22 family protein [Candidatus Scalindua sp.]MCR4344242.1 small ribosomal subunit Rsm22 family protein [Candidatus Scalindua sp.]
MNDMDDFIYSNYLVSYSKKTNLERLFCAYQSPAHRNTYVNDHSLAALYMITRGRSIIGVMDKIIRQHIDVFHDVESVVDFGGGPGTFLFALRKFKTLNKYTNVERSDAFIGIMNVLVEEFLSSSTPPIHVESISCNYLKLESQDVPINDLCVFSYTFCECDNPLVSISGLVENSNMVLIIEPGTPSGFNNIIQARDKLIEKGFSIIAPCTASNGFCPLRDSESDWCHFVERVDRSRIQRHLKNGVLGYEYEKYSYLLMSKSPIQSPARPVRKALPGGDGKRIISRPDCTKHSVSFDICSERNSHIVVTKRENKNEFKIVKKSIRGDLYREDQSKT